MLSSLSSISASQRAALSRANITTQSGLLALTSQELCNKLKATFDEANTLIEAVVKELAPEKLLTVRRVASNTAHRITTGDIALDDVLGGGVRVGVITELVGEGASGKTQLALQLCLLVQLPRGKGGLSGSACYLTTNGVLQTSRLVDIAEHNPSISPEMCNLDDIHTRPTSTVPELKHTLSQGIPHLIQHLSEKPSAKPLKLLILDSLGALFRSDTKTSSKTLFERSRETTEIAGLLHRLASTFHLAIVVINEVNSIFERPSFDLGNLGPDQVLYSEQARWFSRGDSVAAESLKEATLGFVWANQVGIRIMMTRTGRRRHLGSGGEPDAKRRRVESAGRDESSQEPSDDGATLIRRLSVLFSSFSSASSIDFIITSSGLVSLRDGVHT